jgi:hypothetical protein
VAIVEVGALRDVFDTTALRLGDWVVAGLVASSVAVVEAVRRLVVRRRRGRR